MEQVLSALSRKEYSWEELQRKPLPDGVDPSKLETYLNDNEFEVRQNSCIIDIILSLTQYTRIPNFIFLNFIFSFFFCRLISD